MSRNFWQRLRQPGRVFTLRLILYALVVASLYYLVTNTHKLIVDYQNAHNLRELWEVEWSSGQPLTQMMGSGFFQVFLLALGWSAFMRLRAEDIGTVDFFDLLLVHVLRGEITQIRYQETFF